MPTSNKKMLNKIAKPNQIGMRIFFKRRARARERMTLGNGGILFLSWVAIPIKAPVSKNEADAAAAGIRIMPGKMA